MARVERPLPPPAGGPGLRPRTIAAIFLTVAGCALIPAAASAFEIFGFRFFGSDEPEEPIGPDARPYALDVDVLTDDETVTDAVLGASRLHRERDEPPPPSTAALLNRASAEYARIVGVLYTRGYYGGAVTITIDGRDPLSIPADAVLPDPVPIRISVDPGPVFRFGDVSIAGRAPPPEYDDDIVDPSSDASDLTPGAVARSPAVLASERLLVEEWREQGYPKAAIVSRDALANHPTQTLDVSILAESGPQAVFGPIGITGTEVMDPDFVVWMTGIEPGQPFDPDDIARAERNLRRLQVFSATRFVEADAVTEEGTLPMTLTVAERPRRALGAGATYATLDGAGVETYWEHRNLFGRAERLRIEGRVGGIDSVDPEDFNYFLGAFFLKPGVFTPFTDFTAQLSAEQNDLPTYNERTVRARVGLAHEIFEGLKVSTAFNVEASRIEDSIDTRDYLLASLPSDIEYDGRDNHLDPTSGVRARLVLEPFHEFQFGNTGVIADLEASTYWAVDDDGRFVLAARAAVGSVVGAPVDEMPESRLFFAGGGGSVRGYEFRNIGPRVNGDVVGGRSYVEGSLELRAKVTDTIGIVPFVDAGSAFRSSVPDFSEDIKVGAGIGIRYYTGFGPIRADVAVPLNPDDDDPDFAVYIGLGQSF
ncbi:MAG TPA: autotransporter assembly complex family protein [Methylomirabilota bacterium]|nr:autotransporter assembly complex family protein [Methylomirabilota bacterium]